ncbi:MAG: SGNH/GDSL hydrolase family protein [Gemmobacter sp.]
MRIRGVIAAAVAATLLVSGGADRAVAASHDALHVFGDSLSDPGNLFALTGAAGPCPVFTCPLPPSPPYFAGRTSNGPVWADYVAADFAARGLPVGNYAFAYGRVISPGGTPDPAEPATVLPINLEHQIGRFIAETGGTVGPRAVAILWAGANDALNIVGQTAGAIAGGADPAAASAAAVAAAQGVAAALGEAAQILRATGLRNLVVMNLPELGQTPLFAGNPGGQALASLVAGAFNAALALQPFEGLNVTRLDIAALFADLVANPAAYGVSSLDACFDPADPAAGFCPDPNDRAFFDMLHPSAPIHARIAAEVRAVVAPVPLPAAGWLLMAALGGIALHRRRG